MVGISSNVKYGNEHISRDATCYFVDFRSRDYC